MKEWPALLHEVDANHLHDMENFLNSAKQHFIQDRKNHNEKDLRKFKLKMVTSSAKFGARLMAISSEIQHNPDLMSEDGEDMLFSALGQFLKPNYTYQNEINTVSDSDKLKVLDDAIGMIPGIQSIVKELIKHHIPPTESPSTHQAPAVNTPISAA